MDLENVGNLMPSNFTVELEAKDVHVDGKPASSLKNPDEVVLAAAVAANEVFEYARRVMELKERSDNGEDVDITEVFGLSQTYLPCIAFASFLTSN